MLLALLLEVLAPCTPVAVKPEPAELVWTARENLRAWGLSGDALIIQAPPRIVAFDLATGVKRWETPFPRPDARPEWPMVVASDRVYLAVGSTLTILSAKDGTVVDRRQLPPGIHQLEGPPLLAIARNEPRLGSTLFSLDRNGRVRARAITPIVEEVWLLGDLVLVRTLRSTLDEAPETHSLIAFEASRLRRLWRLRLGGADLQQIGGRWYVGDTPWSAMRSLDLRSGRLGAPLPPKEPTEITWGGATWEIEIVSSSGGPPFASCERLRRNDPATGKPRWELDLPFSITNTLRAGSRFYVFGSSSEEDRFIAVVVWETGRVERILSGIPMLLDGLAVRGDLLLGTGTTEGAVAVRLAR